MPLDDTNLAVCYAGKGWLDKAGRVLDDFISSSPIGLRSAGIPRFHYFVLQNDFAGAQNLLGRIFGARTDDKEYAYWQGLLYYHRDNFADAEQIFRRYLVDADGKPDLRHLDALKTVYLVQGKVEAAKKLLDLGLGRANDERTRDYRVGFAEDLAYIHGLSGEYREAVEDIETASRGQRQIMEEAEQYSRCVEREYPYYLPAPPPAGPCSPWMRGTLRGSSAWPLRSRSQSIRSL